MSPMQLLGLAIILVSVLLINLAKYRASALAGKASRKETSSLASQPIPDGTQATPQSSPQSLAGVNGMPKVLEH